MEDVVRRTALFPAMPSPSRCPPPFAPPPWRRSHLDSATYRTLSRIYSSCLHSLPDPNPLPESNENDRTSDCNPSDPIPKEPLCGNPGSGDDSIENLALKEDLQREVGFSEDLKSEEPQLGEEHERRNEGGTNSGILNALERELEKDEGDFSGLSDKLISDFACLIDLVEGTEEGETQAGRTEVGSSELQKEVVEDAKLIDSGNGVCVNVSNTMFEARDEMHRSLEGLRHGKVEEKERDKCLDGNYELATENVSERATTTEKGIHMCCDSVVDVGGLRNLGEEQVSSFRDSLVNEEVEEGEIPDEFQTLELCSDSDHGHSDLDNQNLEERSRENSQEEDELDILNYHDNDGYKVALGIVRAAEHEDKANVRNLPHEEFKYKVVPDTLASPIDLLENLNIENRGKPTNTKDVEVSRKKKRGPMSEERKAKRKKAKKRKRAQKEREQGVKRLKLQPIVKPKTVKYCNYYLKGRCQQGDLCKFSHDTIPLTKSQPCKYFARDTCLKGEDCPFDHELSKYPCHNYMSEGMCIRGDKCRFSHKMPEGSPITPVSGKSDTPLSLEKSTLRKEHNIKDASLANNSSAIITSSAQFLPKSLHLEANLMENHMRPPIRVPNGIHFLSFGKGSLNSSVKLEDSRPPENHSVIKRGNQGSLNCSQKSPLMVQCESRMMSSVHACHPAMNALTKAPSKNISFSNGLATSPSRGLQSEVSDATKILDEFLFGDGS